MQTPQFFRSLSNGNDYGGNPCAIMSSYGFGLSIATYSSGLKRVGHGGSLPGFGRNYVFFPEYGVGIVAFCNLTYTSPYPLSDIGTLLFESLDLEPRQLPASDILAERQKHIVQLIQKWDTEMEARILAENFYLDKSKEDRMAEVQEVLEKAGSIQSIGEIKPGNQLRGSFKLQAENGIIDVFFTLAPEKYPKVQRLIVSFQINEMK